MRITVSGVHMDTGKVLREHAETRMQELRQFFDQVMDVNVKFVQEPHHHNIHVADVTVHVSGLTLHAEGQGIDWYAALDDASTKLVRQLDKYKGRLHKHREKHRKHKESLKDMGPMAFEEASVSEEMLDGMDGVFDEFAPEIVRKEVSKIAPMTVDDAVMQMDLLHKPAFLFLNSGTGKLNMVYREGENTVRWVAPKN